MTSTGLIEMTTLPGLNPISLWPHVFEASIPLDYLGQSLEKCMNCSYVTTLELYRMILGGYLGFGSPWFVKIFISRTTTLGKAGTKSLWKLCPLCHCLCPADPNAKLDMSALIPDNLRDRFPNGLTHICDNCC